MCVTQHAHCQIYSNTRLASLLRKVLPQKTELIVTRYLPDEVLNEGSDKYIYIYIYILSLVNIIYKQMFENNITCSRTYIVIALLLFAIIFVMIAVMFSILKSMYKSKADGTLIFL